MTELVYVIATDVSCARTARLVADLEALQNVKVATIEINTFKDAATQTALALNRFNEQLKVDIAAADVKLSDEVLKGIADIHRQYPMPI